MAKSSGSSLLALGAVAVLSSVATLCLSAVAQNEQKHAEFKRAESRVLKRVANIQKKQMELLQSGSEKANLAQSLFNNVMVRFYEYTEDSLEALNKACDDYHDGLVGMEETEE